MPSCSFARIMRVDHRADAVLQLRDHLAAAVVRGRVGGEEDQHVDVEPDRIAADLHVALFQDVEQPHLHQLVQFRQLVHGEDAAVHAGDQPEVQRLFGRHARARRPAWPGRSRRSRRRTWSRAPAARHSALPAATRRSGSRPRLSSATSAFSRSGDRAAGILVHRAARQVEVRNLLVQEPRQQPHQPALGLALLAQEQQVVLGDQADVDLRNHRVVVADDAGKQLRPRP